MELKPKLLALVGYLGLSEEDINDIEEVSDKIYNYYDDTYKILTDEELEEEIDDVASNIESKVQHEINHIDLSNYYDYSYYIDLSVNYDKIREEVDNNFPYYVGTGTYEEFYEFYIFLM